MEIKRFNRSEGIVLHLSGRFDFNQTASFRRAVQSCMQERSAQVRIDLSEVSYIDSSGLGMLIMLQQNLPAGGRLELFNPQHVVRKALELVNIHRIVHISA